MQDTSSRQPILIATTRYRRARGLTSPVLHTLLHAPCATPPQATHDRLTAAATTYVEKYARSFGGAPAPSEWTLVEGEGRFVFSACGEGDDRVRPFETILGWHDSFRPGASMKFPTVPVCAAHKRGTTIPAH